MNELAIPSISRFEAAIQLAREVSARKATAVYQRLVKEAETTGATRPAIASYVSRGAVVLTCAGAGYALLLSDPWWPLRLLGVAMTAFAFVQGGLIGHDAGHGAISPKWGPNQWMGHAYMTFLSGLSFTHWASAHNKHHANCNAEGTDPDMQVDIFALYAEDARSKRGLARWLTANQYWLFWPALTLHPFVLRKDGLFNALRELRSRKLDVALLLGHFTFWLVVPALVIGPLAAVLNYALATWLVGPYIMSIFLVNHVAAPTVPEGEKLPFLVQQVVTSRNIRGGAVVSWVMGGLNYQIEHHLVPRVSHANLPRVRVLVKQACDELGLPYTEDRWHRAVADIHRHVVAMARLARQSEGQLAL